MASTYLIDPDARLDFGLDWSAWLADGDEIDTSAWAISPAGPALSGSSNNTSTTTVWVTGCTLGVVYTLTNHVETTEGRKDDRSLTLRCVNR